ncbi:thymidylate synthase, partial [Marinomonas pontica]|nr:thymidylate synthase [Marinomonas pontica]
MKQYLDLCNRIVSEGEWVNNERTGKRCLTVINAEPYLRCKQRRVSACHDTKKLLEILPLLKSLGICEGYDNAADFRALGAKT